MDWWRERSRRGRAGLVAAALAALVATIGALAPPRDDDAGDDERTAGAAAAEAGAGEAGPADETGSGEPRRPPPPPPTVAAVVDGDTIRVETTDGSRVVRLLQIDAPEIRRGECYGEASATALRRLLAPGAEVRLASDPALDDVDRYGRHLRYVLLGRTNVNVALVQQGAAAPWFFDGERGRLADRLLAAAEAARAARRGLWGTCSATELDPFAAVATRRAPVPPPPPPPPAAAVPPAESPPAAQANCHPSYTGACLDPNASDYDCAGGEGNGPVYTGTVRVVGYDDYGLDGDGDGVGCE